MKKSSPLEMWVVHDRAAAGVEARKWLWHHGRFTESPDQIRAESVEDLHSRLPPGLIRHERKPDDAPSVLEIWV